MACVSVPAHRLNAIGSGIVYSSVSEFREMRSIVYTIHGCILCLKKLKITLLRITLEYVGKI